MLSSSTQNSRYKPLTPMNTIVMFVPQQQVCNYLMWNMFLNILYF